uniref:GTP pyrophosphokinase n=1 Tax=Vibrio sp. AND4 TaxID=314289 RepID=UPI00015F288D
VILYFESDVNRVSELISNSFGVDVENSLDKSKVLLKDQIGYRSVHFVCTLGNDRAMLPEYSKLTNLKFEVQVRTVLQHAWAELAHDSNYKFSGSLPPEIERKLYLYAGMLEVADKGFDELSSQIDSYKQAIDEQSKLGDFSATIDSISLKEYFDCWADDNDIALENNQKNTSCLIHELNAFGVQTVEDLIDIIPNGYVEAYKEVGEISNIFGIVRDWMLISDWQKFLNNVSFNWMIDRAALKILSKFINGDNLISMLNILDEYGALILDVPYAEHLAEKQLAEQTV